MPTRFDRLCDFGLRIEGAKKATPAMVTLQALTSVSKFINFWRIRYEEGGFHRIFPSTLVLIEAPSGSGKNSVFEFMEDHVFRQASDYMLSILEVQTSALIDQEEARLKAELDDEIIGLPEKEIAKLEKKYENRILTFKNALRSPELVHWDDGSYEGFAQERAFMARLRFGSKTIKSHEFGDRLKQMTHNTFLASMYSRFFELVDSDVLGTKRIKAKEGATEGSRGMGTTLILTYSPLPVAFKERVKEQVLQTLGRRGFLLKETNETIFFHERERVNAEEVEFLANEIDNLARFFESFCEKNPGPDGKGPVVVMNSEAEDWFREYRKAYEEKLNRIYKEWVGSVQKDLLLCISQDLDRKVHRVAVLLGLFNHGEESMDITVEDLVQAQAIVEASFKNAERFFDTSTYNATNSVLAYLQQRKNEWVSARELFDAGLFQVNRDAFQKPIQEFMLRDILIEAEERGFTIRYRENRKQDLYQLMDMDQAEQLEAVKNGAYTKLLHS